MDRPHLEMANIKKAVEFAVKKRADVINMSFSAPGYKDELQMLIYHQLI